MVFEMAGESISDLWMADLARYGLARPFDVEASWSVYVDVDSFR